MEGSRSRWGKIIAGLGIAGGLAGGVETVRRSITADDTKTEQINKTSKEAVDSPDLPTSHQLDLNNEKTKIESMREKVNNMLEDNRMRAEGPIKPEFLLFKEVGDENLPGMSELEKETAAALQAAYDTFHTAFIKGAESMDEADKIYDVYYDALRRIADNYNTKAEQMRQQNK